MVFHFSWIWFFSFYDVCIEILSWMFLIHVSPASLRRMIEVAFCCHLVEYLLRTFEHLFSFPPVVSLLISLFLFLLHARNCLRMKILFVVSLSLWMTSYKWRPKVCWLKWVYFLSVPCVQRPTAKELLKHKFIVKHCKKTSYLSELIDRYRRWKEEGHSDSSSDDSDG